MSEAQNQRQDEQDEQPQQSEGQVSEVQNLDEDDTKTISGADNEAGVGAGAIPQENQRDNEMKAGGRHRLTERIEDE